MENKNDNLDKEKIKSESFSKLDPSNELKSGPEEKLLGDSFSHNTSSKGILGNHGDKEEIRKKILHENDRDRKIENIANNISAESKGGDGLTNRVAFLAGKKKKNKDMTIPIILGVVFVLIVGSALAYYLINKESKQGDPQQIIKSSLEEMSKVKSHSFKGDMDINISSGNLSSGGDPMNFSIGIKFDGQTDQTDPNNIKSSFSINPEINVFADGGNERLSADFSMMSFGKISEQVVYYKLNDFDLGAAGLIYGKMIVPYKDKWYFLDMKELQEMDSASSEKDDFDFEETIEKIMELYQKYEMIKFKKDLGDVLINDQEVYHYQIEVDSEALIDFYIDFLTMMSSEFALSSGHTLEDFEKDLEENREEALALLQEVMANIETEVWIGKEDKLVHKIYVSGNYDQEALARIENIPLRKARARASDAGTKSDMSRLRVDLELYYDSNDNTYIGFDPMSLHYYDSENMNIITDDSSYLIWAESAATTDKWCVDSSGAGKFVYGDIKGTQCDSIEDSRGETRKYTDLEKEDDVEIGGDNSLNFKMNLSLSNFNQPIKITRPEEAENLVEIMEEMFGGFMGGMTPSSSGPDFDNDGLNNEMEEIYGTDKNNPDTDGDGFKDGEEVKNGYDPTISGNARLNYDELFSTP
ncbi:hypothetical protein KAS31_01325 [Candidatus Parcubacteria bacterium]|nr:hypothetical protein [Candidatus Parcubacteria bacterium]